VLHRKDDNICIKHKGKNLIGNILLLVFLIIFCIFTFFNTIDIHPEGKWLNIDLNNNYVKIFIQIVLILFIGISIMDLIFYNHSVIFINIKTKCVNFTIGRWKFSKKIILNFNQIKNIVLINCMEMVADCGKVYSYKIDIYDYELNAYEIYADKDFDKIEKIALEIAEIVEIEINDWTHIENYEGYIKKII
jgi:hypothetical protein